MPVPYKFQTLLAPPEGTREADKLATLSAQVKVEHDLLAEIMFTGNKTLPDLDFYLEEKGRDLTVRRRLGGSLVDWIEAKMCYTDCLARQITGPKNKNVHEFQTLLKNDVEKQKDKSTPEDRGTLFTSLLFAVHRDKPVPRQKYYPNFRNRGCRAPSEIEKEALR